MNPTFLLLRATLLTGALTAAVTLSSCTPYQQQGAAVGGLGGLAVGAVAGDSSEDALRGAAIGAALGTGAAALKEQSDRNRGYYNTGGDRPAPPAQPPAPPRTNYPTATKTDNPNLVVSPYKPHNVIDVQGFQSGQLAKDPSNNQIFRVP